MSDEEVDARLREVLGVEESGTIGEREEPESEGMSLGWTIAGLASLVAAFSFGVATGVHVKPNYSPRTIVPSSDLNQDNVEDAVVGTLKRRIPLYGVKDGDKVRYVSAEEMKKLNPTAVVDYERIEEMVNQTE
jgi:hypothetical protein